MIELLIEWLRSQGDLSITVATILALVFFLASFVFVPRTFLYLGVGGLYGLQVVPIVLLSNILGSVFAFLTARHLLADALQQKMNQYPHLSAISNAIDSESWRIVALFRFASPVPSSVQNYFFGLTRIRLWPYSIATFVFTIPQTFLYLHIGAVGRNVLLEDSTSPLSRILLVVGVVCLAAIVYLIWRKARMVLNDPKMSGVTEG